MHQWGDLISGGGFDGANRRPLITVVMNLPDDLRAAQLGMKTFYGIT